jgi:ribulose-bisphosphate carboxylase large chain
MIRAVYHITAADAGRAEQAAQDIALEQTVEVPDRLVTDPHIRETVVGRVVTVTPLPDLPGRWQIEILFNPELTGWQLPQLLNLVFGNISMKRGIRLVDLMLPPELRQRFGGPRYGIEGLRETIGIHDRPLLATALKPRGSSSRTLAALAEAFARGGGDLIKDDHNLVDPDFDAFRERVLRCRDAVEAANAANGRRTLYLPNIMHPNHEIDRYLDLLVAEGIPGVLISPLVLGFDVVRHVASRYPLFLMAHPSFSGVYYSAPDHGIDPGLLLGKLMRLAGCDASVFPNHGGRFMLDPVDCDSIGQWLRIPMGKLRPSWPAPAGGMNFDRLDSMADQYGPDTIFLIGGGLLSHSDDLASSTAGFLDAIRNRFGEHLASPQTPPAFASACEIPAVAANARAELRERLPFHDYTWEGRAPIPYKADASLPFQGVARHELIGPAGEQAAFDLRYFEVAPGGFTSLERHRHTHTIIGVRGEGVLLSDRTRIPVGHLDIAYVPSMRPHQLLNEGAEPFGFFCIVDRRRDRPQPA